MADTDPASISSHVVGDPARLTKCALASGATIQVVDREADWFNETRDEYLHQAKFTERTDLQDLDRLLAMELSVFRSTQHLAAGVDYEGSLIDEHTVQRDIKLMSAEISSIKKSMGLSKEARDAAANEGSVAGYIADLKSRARAFGVMREKQLGVALVLMKEIFSTAGSHMRADEEERVKLGFETAEDVLKWIMEDVKPRFDEVDEYFREHEQRFWIRQQ